MTEPHPQAAPAVVHETPAPLPGKGSRSGLLKKLNPVNLFKKETPERFVRLGETLLEQKNFAQATIAFNRALSLDKECADAYAGLGDCLAKKGGRVNMQNALELYEQAILRNPFDEDVYVYRAKIFDAMGKRKEATLERKKMVVVKTLTTDPRNAVANNNMGILLLRNNQTEAAIEYFRKSVETDPSYEVAYRNLATVYFNLSKAAGDEAKKKELLEQAQVHITKALELLKSIPTLLVAARVLMANGENEPALELVTQAEAQDPAHKDVFGLKKLLLERLNRMEEARQAYASYRMFSSGKMPDDL
ncbi:MAG: tetratricopeptide repeat protein [Candidatus Lambdaproteobacteria bacterium]|nr:tetratricopeptide repeat protein [Candidatus Lambdaproteobacteria bacterium]